MKSKKSLRIPDEPENKPEKEPDYNDNGGKKPNGKNRENDNNRNKDDKKQKNSDSKN